MTKHKRYSIILTVTCLVVFIMTGVIMAIGHLRAQQLPTDVMEITVAYGDTLWTIAKDIAPYTDPRKVVWEIQQLNQISSSQIYPGQTLLVPIYEVDI